MTNYKLRETNYEIVTLLKKTPLQYKLQGNFSVKIRAVVLNF